MDLNPGPLGIGLNRYVNCPSQHELLMSIKDHKFRF